MVAVVKKCGCLLKQWLLSEESVFSTTETCFTIFATTFFTNSANCITTTATFFYYCCYFFTFTGTFYY